MILNRYSGIRSVLESPVLDERKWAKIPSVPCDAVLVDMEDSVPLGRKEEGRQRVLEVLAALPFFGDRVVIPRPNPLASPWGYNDVVALADAGVDCMMYPKVGSAGEVREVQSILRDHGADPDLVICIETPRAVAHVEEIACVPGVVALVFGEGDLSAELGIPIHVDDGQTNPGLLPARMRTVMAAAAAGIPMLDFAVLSRIKDLDEYRRRITELLRLGASGICTIYPPHVYVVNELLTPGADEVAQARAVAAAFEAAVAGGSPAVRLEDGRTILIHDYTKALRVIERGRRH